jgi:hypothetical protein
MHERERKLLLSLTQGVSICEEVYARVTQRAPELTRVVSTANASAHTVTYSTPGFGHRRGGNAGQLATEVFYSVDAAKNAPFPPGFTFARFEADGGVYVFHSSAFDWEFFKS